MATFRLAKYIGLGHAKRFMLTCEQIDAARAAELGMIDWVVDDLEQGLARAIDALGPNHSVAVTLTRRLLNESYANALENAIGHFLAAQHRAISQSAFLQTLQKHGDSEPK
jgi:enoyl-CoA hydratase/carnithine racemase